MWSQTPEIHFQIKGFVFCHYDFQAVGKTVWVSAKERKREGGKLWRFVGCGLGGMQFCEIALTDFVTVFFHSPKAHVCVDDCCSSCEETQPLV